jgi:hypothetical protein
MSLTAVITMKRESAYIKSDLFMDWLVNHFIPQKTNREMSVNFGWSDMNSYEMLQTAADNDIMLLCLSRHLYIIYISLTTFLKPLKTYFIGSCDESIQANPNKKIKRCHFGVLVSNAWFYTAAFKVAISGF